MMRLLIAIAAAGAVTALARADTVTLRGSEIPLPNCRVQDIKAGRVYYADSRGRRQWRELEDVAALGFDGLPELDQAEKLLAAGEADDGLGRLLKALVSCEGDLARLWVRLRLVRVHDGRGEYVQAVGHIAAVFMLREESYWRLLAPLSRPDRPHYAAAKETLDLLQRARRALGNRDLIAAADRFLEVVKPIHDELAASYDGPPIPAGSTLSGIAIEQIASGQFQVGAARPPAVTKPTPREASSGRREPAPSRREEPTPTAAPETPAGDAPEAIDALLSAGRSGEALAVCRRVAQRPGNRSLSRFLHQYGQCLAAQQQPRDAAVMFMRCAVLYESSHHATMSLIETAAICRDEFDSPASARRLLQRAIQSASAQEREDLAARASEMLAALEGMDAK